MRNITLCTVILFMLSIIGCGQPNLNVECSMNGLGNGVCDFTNTGEGSGALCGEVTVVDKNGREIKSSVFCSGNIERSTTKRVEFAVGGVSEFCAADGQSWSDVCSFTFTTDDAEYNRKLVMKRIEEEKKLGE